MEILGIYFLKYTAVAIPYRGRCPFKLFSLNKNPAITSGVFNFSANCLLESITQTAVPLMTVDVGIINFAHINIAISGIQVQASVQAQ